MKKLYLLLLSFAFLFTKAQTDFRFADSTAQWNVLETWQGWCWCFTWDTHLVKINGDTLIDSKMYQVLNYTSNIPPLEVNGKFYLRKDSIERVYGRVNVDSQDYLIYDFSKQTGDTFSIGIGNKWPYSVFITIDSVSNIFWGYNRKVQYVTTKAIGSFNDVFVEGIGSLRSFFLYPGVEYTFIDGPNYDLLCLFENGINVYHDTLYNTCLLDSMWMGAEKLETGFVSVLMSSGRKEATVQFKGSSNLPALFSAYDLTGRLLLEKEMTEQTTRMDLNALDKGVYLYEVVSDKQRIKSGKLLVE